MNIMLSQSRITALCWGLFCFFVPDVSADIESWKKEADEIWDSNMSLEVASCRYQPVKMVLDEWMKKVPFETTLSMLGNLVRAVGECPAEITLSSETGSFAVEKGLFLYQALGQYSLPVSSADIIRLRLLRLKEQVDEVQSQSEDNFLSKIWLPELKCDLEGCARVIGSIKAKFDGIMETNRQKIDYCLITDFIGHHVERISPENIPVEQITSQISWFNLHSLQADFSNSFQENRVLAAMMPGLRPLCSLSIVAQNGDIVEFLLLNGQYEDGKISIVLNLPEIGATYQLSDTSLCDKLFSLMSSGGHKLINPEDYRNLLNGMDDEMVRGKHNAIHTKDFPMGVYTEYPVFEILAHDECPMAIIDNIHHSTRVLNVPTQELHELLSAVKTGGLTEYIHESSVDLIEKHLFSEKYADVKAEPFYPSHYMAFLSPDGVCLTCFLFPNRIGIQPVDCSEIFIYSDSKLLQEIQSLLSK